MAVKWLDIGTKISSYFSQIPHSRTYIIKKKKDITYTVQPFVIWKNTWIPAGTEKDAVQISVVCLFFALLKTLTQNSKEFKQKSRHALVQLFSFVISLHSTQRNGEKKVRFAMEHQSMLGTGKNKTIFVNHSQNSMSWFSAHEKKREKKRGKEEKTEKQIMWYGISEYWV